MLGMNVGGNTGSEKETEPPCASVRHVLVPQSLVCACFWGAAHPTGVRFYSQLQAVGFIDVEPSVTVHHETACREWGTSPYLAPHSKRELDDSL